MGIYSNPSVVWPQCVDREEIGNSNRIFIKNKRIVIVFIMKIK